MAASWAVVDCAIVPAHHFHLPEPSVPPTHAADSPAAEAPVSPHGRGAGGGGASQAVTLGVREPRPHDRQPPPRTPADVQEVPDDARLQLGEQEEARRGGEQVAAARRLLGTDHARRAAVTFTGPFTYLGLAMTSPTNGLVRLLDRTPESRGDDLQAIAHIVIALLRAADLRSRPMLVDSLHEQVDTMPMVFRDVRTNEKRRYSRGPGPPNHLNIDLWKAHGGKSVKRVQLPAELSEGNKPQTLVRRTGKTVRPSGRPAMRYQAYEVRNVDARGRTDIACDTVLYHILPGDRRFLGPRPPPAVKGRGSGRAPKRRIEDIEEVDLGQIFEARGRRQEPRADGKMLTLQMADHDGPRPAARASGPAGQAGASGSSLQLLADLGAMAASTTRMPAADSAASTHGPHEKGSQGRATAAVARPGPADGRYRTECPTCHRTFWYAQEFATHRCAQAAKCDADDCSAARKHGEEAEEGLEGPSRDEKYAELVSRMPARRDASCLDGFTLNELRFLLRQNGTPSHNMLKQQVVSGLMRLLSTSGLRAAHQAVAHPAAGAAASAPASSQAAALLSPEWKADPAVAALHPAIPQSNHDCPLWMSVRHRWQAQVPGGWIHKIV